MKPEHSIEEHFRSEFSDWTPAVPPTVKSQLDKAILAPKRKGFLWLWMLIPLFFLCIGTLVYFYSTNFPNEAKNQAENSSVSELNSAQNDKNVLNTSESSSEQNNNKLDANSIAHQDDRISSPQDNFKNPDSKQVSRKSKSQNSRDKAQNGNDTPVISNSASAFANDVPQNTTSNRNSNHVPELAPAPGILSQDNATPNSSAPANTSSNASQLSTESEPSSQVRDTSSQNSSKPVTNPIAVDSIQNSSVVSDNPAPLIEVPNPNLAFSKFFIGGSFSILQGKNSGVNPGIQLTEKLSYNGALELGYKFNKSFALVSGFNYQARRENFQSQSFQVDSNFLGVEIQYIYEPNNPIPVDSITIVMFNYDTTFTSIQQRGSWRHFGLPLFVDWTMYEQHKFSFGLQAGTVLGLASFKSFDAFNNPLQQWSKFSNQWLIKPYFYYHMGPWRFGAQLSFQYDLVLPQAWELQNRKRYAYGLGFSIRYQLPAR
jgi:hypothetical protein